MKGPASDVLEAGFQAKGWNTRSRAGEASGASMSWNTDEAQVS
jgi:hypothetical protein